MIHDVGKKIKKLRTNRKLTLKELSEKTNFSIGFLSQLERGLTTIAIDSLEKIADELGVNLEYFFSNSAKKANAEIVHRHYEREVFQIHESKLIQYHLTNDRHNKTLLPRMIEILPMNKKEHIEKYPHIGEEFVYVLEGVVTLSINEKEYQLYPGDSAHYSSENPHNWANYTNKPVKILVVSTPNHFRE